MIIWLFWKCEKINDAYTILLYKNVLDREIISFSKKKIPQNKQWNRKFGANETWTINSKVLFIAL